jgi:ribonuclease T
MHEPDGVGQGQRGADAGGFRPTRLAPGAARGVTGGPTMPEPKYISVDVEATGPAPGVYSMVSIGAWVVGEPGRTFYAELKPITNQFDKRAMAVAMPGRTHASLFETGEDPELVMERFTAWVEETREGKRFDPVFVAHNAPFDWMFVAWYFWRFVGRNPFGWAALDMRAYFMALTDNDWAKTRLEDMKKRFPTKRNHKHHALEDAIEQGELFERMLAAREAGRTDDR